MKKILKYRKFREILKLAETNIIGVYIFENGDFQIFDVEETKKKLFLEKLLSVFPAITTRTNFSKVESKSLQELKSAMTEIVSILPERRKMVMIDFLGLADEIPIEKIEIAEKHNITLAKVNELFHYGREDLWQRDSLGKFIKILNLKDLWMQNQENPHPISHIPFSTRTYKALKSHGFDSLEQLSSKTEEEVLRIHNFGQKSLTELKSAMSKAGLSFAESKRSKSH